MFVRAVAVDLPRTHVVFCLLYLSCVLHRSRTTHHHGCDLLVCVVTCRLRCRLPPAALPPLAFDACLDPTRSTVARTFTRSPRTLRVFSAVTTVHVRRLRLILVRGLIDFTVPLPSLLPHWVSTYTTPRCWYTTTTPHTYIPCPTHSHVTHTHSRLFHAWCALPVCLPFPLLFDSTILRSLPVALRTFTLIWLLVDTTHVIAYDSSLHTFTRLRTTLVCVAIRCVGTPSTYLRFTYIPVLVEDCCIRCVVPRTIRLPLLRCSDSGAVTLYPFYTISVTVLVTLICCCCVVRCCSLRYSRCRFIHSHTTVMLILFVDGGDHCRFCVPPTIRSDLLRNVVVPTFTEFTFVHSHIR